MLGQHILPFIYPFITRSYYLRRFLPSVESFSPSQRVTFSVRSTVKENNRKGRICKVVLGTLFGYLFLTISKKDKTFLAIKRSIRSFFGTTKLSLQLSSLHKLDQKNNHLIKLISRVIWNFINNFEHREGFNMCKFLQILKFLICILKDRI